MEIKQFDSPVALITWDENGIFTCKLKDSKSTFDTQETKDHFDFLLKHAQGKPYKVILDTTESFNFPTDGSFEYFFKINKSENKIAIVTNTLSMRLLIEQTFHYNKVDNAQFFRTMDDAYEWICKQ